MPTSGPRHETRGRMAAFAAVTLTLLLALIALTVPGCGNSTPLTGTAATTTTTAPAPTSTSGAPSSTGVRTVTIGALLSLTGEWSDLGKASQAALQLAVEKANADLTAQGVTLRVALMVEDTALDPALCLEKMKSLAAKGVRLMIGPQSSGEVLEIKAFADQNGIVVISQGSTAGSLAIPDDNILRFCPDDSHEGTAVATLMWVDGVRAVVPIWRGDPGNLGLSQAVRRSFTTIGGKVAEGLEYKTDSTDFSPDVEKLKAQVKALEEAGTPLEQVGVYLAAFDEVADIFALAKEEPRLFKLKWYGSDGAQRASVIKETATASFALAVGYPNPMLGLDRSREDVWAPVAERIKQVAGVAPDAFALCAYDALLVAAKALQQAGGYANAETLKRALVMVADSSTGLTGPTTLNQAGDRTLATYDFWSVASGTDGFSWVLTAVYQPGAGAAAGTIQRVATP